MKALTLIRVAISLAGILSGFVVSYGMLTVQRLPGWTKVFLITTVLTSVTGFFFPIHGVTPALITAAVRGCRSNGKASTPRTQLEHDELISL